MGLKIPGEVGLRGAPGRMGEVVVPAVISLLLVLVGHVPGAAGAWGQGGGGQQHARQPHNRGNRFQMILAGKNVLVLTRIN